MNSLHKRRMLRSRRERRGGGKLRPLLIALLGLFALGSACAAAGVGALFAIYNSYAKDYVPITEKLRQNNSQLTTIYDRNGPCTAEFDGCVVLGSLTNADAQLLSPIPLEQISQYMVDATVSTEDNSFWDNPGVNIKGLVRAAYENYVLNDFGGGTGGSSITQQLIKNVYICPNIGSPQDICLTAPRTLDRKLREITYALELEKDYTKEEILQWYLNQTSYADRYVGVEAASQGYFHKPAKDLTLAESALLAGIPSFPTKYHPRLNCVSDDAGKCIVDSDGRTTVGGDAKQREEDVLDLMETHGRASKEQVETAKAEELKVFAASNDLKAEAFIDDQVEPRLVRMCEAGLLPKAKGAADCKASVHGAGYQVTSTLDFEMTDLAEQLAREWIRQGLANGCECNNAAIVTIDPATGQVMVYAPNRDPSYRSDRKVAGDIDQLNEINQPGSSFKPAVYLTWFDEQVKNPMSILWDTSPLQVEGATITNPRNDGRRSDGLISARSALGGSQNVGAFRAAAEAGADNVIGMAKKLGITTLDQHFDPTWHSHEDVTYGASIATGGANIKAIDMAYMEATIANMGLMRGTPTLAKTLDMKKLKSFALDTGDDYTEATKQAEEFSQGYTRLPGTRELDPIAVLQVRDANGEVIYTEPPAQEKQVVNAGSVWLLQSIMTDCTARRIIWGCGGSNDDLGLDVFLDGTRLPAGVKTGTQQGPKAASDTLETWTTGFTRHASTAVWVGNATNELVNDRQFASANATLHLYKHYMEAYHQHLVAEGVTDIMKDFSDLRPKNVAQREILSATTSQGLAGGCNQRVTAWVRTDVSYAPECEEREIDTRNGFLATDETPAQFRETKRFVKLPAFKPDAAIALAKEMGIPIAPTEKSNGQVAVGITNLSNGKTVSATTQVIGSVNVSKLNNWELAVGQSSSPSEWKTIGSGTANIDGVLGTLDITGLKDGVYTVRLSTDDGKGLSTSVVINIKKQPAGGLPSITPQPGIPGATPTRTATTGPPQGN